VAGGRLSYVHNLSGWREYRVDADIGSLAPGEHTLAFRYTPGVERAPGRGELLVDGAVVADGEIKRFTWSRFSLTNHGITIGHTFGTPPADRDYSSPFRFRGAVLDRGEGRGGGGADRGAGARAPAARGRA
jgi:hypothetical protein